MRLIAEHLKHGGAENGRLRVSYKQFAVWTGVKESEIAGALAELVDLGFVEILHGWRPAGAAKWRPNAYRLTFLPDHEDAAPTNEWKRWEPSKGVDAKAWREALARAKAAARAARVRHRSRGRGSFRSEKEAAAAAAPAEALLKRLGKERVGRPGNKQTRAALNEHNSRSFPPRCRPYADHGPDRTVEKPGGHGADRTVEGHGANRTVPSTPPVFLRNRVAEQRSDRDSSAREPYAGLKPAARKPANVDQGFAATATQQTDELPVGPSPLQRGSGENSGGRGRLYRSAVVEREHKASEREGPVLCPKRPSAS
jgi:hypothetical protein